LFNSLEQEEFDLRFSGANKLFKRIMTKHGQRVLVIVFWLECFGYNDAALEIRERGEFQEDVIYLAR
jgi:hypothetical protein